MEIPLLTATSEDFTTILALLALTCSVDEIGTLQRAAERHGLSLEQLARRRLVLYRRRPALDTQAEDDPLRENELSEMPTRPVPIPANLATWPTPPGHQSGRNTHKRHHS